MVESVVVDAPAILSVDQAAVVGEDIPCCHCGYNLRGLEVGGNCPECGAGVGPSIAGDLRDSSPQWLRSLARGARLIVGGLVLVFVMTLLPIFVIWAGWGMWTWMYYAGIAGRVAMIAGGWLLTEPDPSGVGEERYGRAREFIRVSLALSIAPIVFDLADLHGLSHGSYLSLLIVRHISADLSAVSEIVMLNYLALLMRRIPSPRHVRRANLLIWTFGSAVIAMTFIGEISTWLPEATPRAMLEWIGGVGTIVNLVALVLWVFYAVFLEQVARQFIRQIGANACVR